MSAAKSSREPTLASIVLAEGGDEEFWWNGEPGKRGAVVFKTDRFGQRWTLDIEGTHWVTQRVAAGLLGVSVMTVHNWIREGKITETKKRKVLSDMSLEDGKFTLGKKQKRVSVIALKEVEKIAEARGVFVRKELTPEQRRAMRAASFNRKKGGEKNADES